MARKDGEKVKKVRRIVVVIVSMIIVFTLINCGNIVWAEGSNASIDIPQIINSPNVNESYYKSTENLFCVEYNQSLSTSGNNNYESIPYFMEIEGKKAQLFVMASLDGKWQYKPEDSVNIDINWT